ncbi:MAG: hypothetical protein Rubg2KO_24060 [Rubricoccaceae bacterium]
MLAGHFATALVARQRTTARRFSGTLLGWYLVISQVPDLLWLSFHYLGLEPTQPGDLFDVTLQTLSVDMVFSHDLVPIVGWAMLFGVLGAVVFKDQRVGLASVVLIGLHALTDYLGGYPHHVLGPETASVGTGLYLTAPFAGVALEAVYTVGFVGWFLVEERRRGTVRSAGNRRALVGLFVFNILFMASIATTSMREWFGLPEVALPFETTVPTLAVTYLSMGAFFWWVVRADRASSLSALPRP